MKGRSGVYESQESTQKIATLEGRVAELEKSLKVRTQSCRSL
jgi:hypothetical protein